MTKSQQRDCDWTTGMPEEEYFIQSVREKYIAFIAYFSDFQPGFRGTQGLCQGFRSWPVKITQRAKSRQTMS